MRKRILALLLGVAMTLTSLNLSALTVYAEPEGEIDIEAETEIEDIETSDIEIAETESDFEDEIEEEVEIDIEGDEEYAEPEDDTEIISEEVIDEVIEDDDSEEIELQDDYTYTLSYTLSEDEEYYIVSGFSGTYSGAFVIPTEYNGKPVTETGTGAFSGRGTFLSVSLPNTLTKIGDKAFCNWYDYEGSITIPASVTEIGNLAFGSMYKLQSLTIEEGTTKGVVTIGSQAFDECGIKSLSIPGSVKKIGVNAFNGSSIETLSLAEGIEEIDGLAFNNCPIKGTVTIPSTVTTIPSNYPGAFQGCGSIDKVINNSNCTVTLPVHNKNSDGTVWVNEATGETITHVPAGATAVLKVDLIAPQEYTGKKITPKPVIKDGDYTLVEGKDYKLSYKNNINVGKATATVTEIGNYTKKFDIEFDITPKYISQSLDTLCDGFSVTIADKKFNNKVQKSKPVVYFGKTKLVENRDYTLKYLNEEEEEVEPKEVGKYTVRIDAKGNFHNDYDINYVIYAAGEGLSEKYVAPIPDVTFTGNEIDLSKVQIMVKSNKKDSDDMAYIRGTDYSVDWALGSDTINVGTKTLILKSENPEKCTGTKSVTFKVVPRDINADGIVVSVAAGTYNGTALKPDVALSDNTNKIDLTSDDYTLTYSNNVNAATPEAGKKAPTVTIKGKGNYKGTMKANFLIKPCQLSRGNAEKFNVFNMMIPDIKKDISKVTQKDIKPAITYLNTATGKTITLKKDKDFKVDYDPENPNITKENGDIKTVEVKIEFIGNYTHYKQGGMTEVVSGTFNAYKTQTVIDKENFKITYYDVAEESSSEYFPPLTYTGQKLTYDPGLIQVGARNYFLLLTQGKDYTISYINNVNVAALGSKKAPTIKITGKGMYKGTIIKTFDIEPMVISDEIVRGNISFKVEGVLCNPNKEQLPKVTVINNITGKALKNKTDYTFELLPGCTTKVGCGDEGYQIPYIQVTGINNYDGCINAGFYVYKTSIAKMVFDNVANQNYTGQSVKPSGDAVKIYSDKSKNDDVKLVEGTDYVLSYGENIKAGVGTITVTGKGTYGGSKTIKFVILPKWLHF